MGNLKDINYGIGKYLELSDASTIPDIGTNRKNLDLLNFKVATNNAYSLYNFKDGIIDAYQDSTGVDDSASTNEQRNSSGKYYQGIIAAAGNSASGILNTYGAYASNTFLTSSTFDAGTTGATVDILLVGGGGSGGNGMAGGGGAGQSCPRRDGPYRDRAQGPGGQVVPPGRRPGTRTPRPKKTKPS